MQSESVRVRLTMLEKEKLVELAKKHNLNISEYVRYCCLIEPPKRVNQEKVNQDK